MEDIEIGMQLWSLQSKIMYFIIFSIWFLADKGS